MPAARAARYLTLAGLAAGAAAAAHGGWGELSDPRWTGAAVLGAALAAIGVASTEHRPLTVLEAAAVLVAAQVCAHAALLLAGAPAHPGGGGTLALHVALALAAALVTSAADRALGKALTRLDTAAGRLLELLATVSPARPPRRASVPRPAPSGRLPLGRAPPLAA
jgi:hypothetical protein